MPGTFSALQNTARLLRQSRPGRIAPMNVAELETNWLSSQASRDLLVGVFVAAFGLSVLWIGWRLYGLLGAGYAPLYWLGGVSAATIIVTGLFSAATAYPLAGHGARVWYGPLAGATLFFMLLLAGP